MYDLLSYSAQFERLTDPRPWHTASFAQQQAVLDDPSKRKALLCPRRAGKTQTVKAGLLDALFAKPSLPTLYITLTQGTSMGLLWEEMVRANELWSLGLKPSISDGKLMHEKGGYIWFAGCKDIREAEKYRGYKYSRVIVDEGGTHRDSVLTYFVKDVINWALTDASADLWIAGTPGPVPDGYFWAVSTGEDPKVKQWSTHSWTVLDNPHHAFYSNPELIRQYREDELGVSEDDPTWIREGLGRWCLDTNAIIYYADPTKTAWDGVIPDGPRRTVLGVDFGYDDETAFVVTTSVLNHPTVYVQHAHGKSEMMIGGIAEEIRNLQRRYGVQEIYCDSGGLGKTILHTLRADYNLPVIPAEKQDKAGAIQRVKQGLHAGDIKLDRLACKPLLDEWNVLVWDDHRKGHREGMPDHNSDAFLYSYRPHLHWRVAAPPPPRPVGERVNEELKRRAMRR